MMSNGQKIIEKALSECNEEIEWYEKYKISNRRLYYTCSLLTLVFCGITPLFIILPAPVGIGPEIMKVFQALPAVLATIATGISKLYKTQENWIRFSVTSEKLKTERVKFERRVAEYAPPLSEQKALENFTLKTKEIVNGETSEWGDLIRKSDEEKSKKEAPASN
ncbi:MAG: DUF4231 domain-containing protein [Vulcanimicrobiota bacterium]